MSDIATYDEAANLSAFFPGLIDLCVADNGEVLFLHYQENGQAVLSERVMTDFDLVVPPGREYLPYLLPDAQEVMSAINEGDCTQLLYEDVLKHLKCFSSLDDQQWILVAHFIFLTYLHDHSDISYCPYLLFYAVPERGKSRTGKSVCYLSFRGIHLIELRPPILFRYSHNLHGTLFLDLLDITQKAKRNDCEDILLLRAEKGAKIPRVTNPEKGPFQDTTYYDIYGPTIIASNEQLHKILETRCLPIIMPNHPGNYENPKPELAFDLKNRLTAWRARYLSQPLPDVEPIEGINGRLWDISKPLIQIAQVIDSENVPLVIEALQVIAGEKSLSRSNSTEGSLVVIIKELTEEKNLSVCSEWEIRTAEILSLFNNDRPVENKVKPQWIGKKLKSMSIRHRTVNGRSEIQLTQDEYKILLEQYGFNSHPTNSLPEKSESKQDHLRVVGSGRELQYEQGADDEIPF
jgi:hypothetical protein